MQFPQIAIGIDIQSIYKKIININDSGTILKIIKDGPTTLFQNQLLTQESFKKHYALLLMRHFFPSIFYSQISIRSKYYFTKKNNNILHS